MDQKRRIGIYGGSFDPVHSGHLEIARRLSQLFELDEILFVPALHAPHKLSRPVTSHLHRYAMLILATQREPQMKVSTFEIEASDRRYTVDTLAHFQSCAGDVEVFFIMGADSWAEITTWREWQRLLSMTNHIVVTRPGFEVRGDHLPPNLREGIIDLRSGGKESPRTDRPRTIFITDAVMKDVSATDIRRLAGEGRFEDLRQLVPPAVAEHIEKYGLYRDSNEA